MYRPPIVIMAAMGLLGVSLAVPAFAISTQTGSGASATAVASGDVLRVARQTLAPSDGWAAAGSGTVGGSAADDAHVSVVGNRRELVAALGGDNATNATNGVSKIVLVKGTIDLNADDAGNKLDCSAYADPAYDLPSFLTTFDPAVWGRVNPSGPLEDARVRSASTQAAQVMINVGSNTTILGLKGARLLGGNLMIGNPKVSVSNVIVRNLTFEDAYDCFPLWSPTDGTEGNWNSAYDTLSVIRGTNVWLDHNTFSDGNNTDDKQPLYFGRPYQVHDGLSDITKGSDYVTVSYNLYREHDKSILIGATNTPGNPATSPTADLGRLRVTLHHNLFANLGQRVPRVRFGQVDVYDNYFYETDESTFQYAWGVGVQSAIYAENNFFLRSADIPLDAFVYNWGGTAMTEKGTMTAVGTGQPLSVNLLDAFNTANPASALGADAGWTPTLRTKLDPTRDVPTIVKQSAGAGNLSLG
jgi:pectate lyase